jgi:hypothetical protein
VDQICIEFSLDKRNLLVNHKANITPSNKDVVLVDEDTKVLDANVLDENNADNEADNDKQAIAVLSLSDEDIYTIFGRNKRFLSLFSPKVTSYTQGSKYYFPESISTLAPLLYLSYNGDINLKVFFDFCYLFIYIYILLASPCASQLV